MMSNCDICSRYHGFTLWSDGNITNHSILVDRLDATDPYWNDTCAGGFECVVDQEDDEHGCCIECGPGKFCEPMSIAPFGSYLESNVCPNGYTCSDERGITMCPVGTICWHNETLNCTDAVERSLWRELLNGTFCPSGTAYLEMCPTGRYCRTPGNSAICPAGYFCMLKSVTVWLRSHCPEGSLTLCRSEGGMIALIVVAVVLVVGFIAIKVAKKAIENANGRLSKIMKTFISIAGSRLSNFASNVKAQQQGISQGNGFTSSALDSFGGQFNQYVDEDGFIYYDEANNILQLSSAKLSRFRYVMNMAACLSANSDKVKIHVFEEHFSKSLFVASHIEPTEDDIKELFELLDQNNDGRLAGDELYNSRLADFLEDGEINDLIKEFRSRKGESVAKQKLWKQVVILKSEFYAHYASILEKVTSKNAQALRRGTDIAFQDLCLTVRGANGESKNVVDHVTGRIEEQKITALMGGSGTGKTSLLNALCGRAFYAKVSGKVFVNGNEGVTGSVSPSIGFVPQDDVVCAELTVLENFLYAGRFRLPSGTPTQEIYDLADSVIAELGLARVKHGVVGDVTRRGLSGGERKRVNCGLELMARPSLLFLDEPTSGLDSASSLQVVRGLKSLVSRQNVTICAVVHQPRKFIFEDFDNLVLLSVGGKMCYHGPTTGATEYFNNLGYKLPPGENVADWIIDISSGSLAPQWQKSAASFAASTTSQRFDRDNEEKRRANLNDEWISHFENLNCMDRKHYEPPESFKIPEVSSKPSLIFQIWLQIKRRVLVMKRNKVSHLIDALVLIAAFAIVPALSGILQPVNDSNPGRVSYENLERSLVPETEDLEVIRARVCNIMQDSSQQDVVSDLIAYAVSASFPMQQFGLLFAAAATIIIGISSTKPIRNKRMEFFREAGSGYSIDAYFIAICIVSTIEITIQVILGGLVTLWIRDTIILMGPFLVNCILLAWLASGWGLFYASWVPPENVFLVVGFHMMIFLFLSGVATANLSFKMFYEKPGLNAVAGLFAPARFFIEAYAVGEERCLEPQSGFTSETLMLSNSTSFDVLGLAMNDPNVSIRSCDGWWWNFLPMFLVGFTLRFVTGCILHVANRTKMPMTSFVESFRSRRGFRLGFFVLVFIGAGLVALTVWSFVAVRGEPKLSDEDLLCSLFGVEESRFETCKRHIAREKRIRGNQGGSEGGGLGGYCGDFRQA